VILLESYGLQFVNAVYEYLFLETYAITGTRTYDLQLPIPTVLREWQALLVGYKDLNQVVLFCRKIDRLWTCVSFRLMACPCAPYYWEEHKCASFNLNSIHPVVSSLWIFHCCQYYESWLSFDLPCSILHSLDPRMGGSETQAGGYCLEKFRPPSHSRSIAARDEVRRLYLSQFLCSSCTWMCAKNWLK